MSSGIYKLEFKGTNKVYIGQSKDLEQRRYAYITKKKFHSTKLIRAYMKYGTPCFTIIEYCDLGKLDTRELYFINLYNSVYDGYNTKLGIDYVPDYSGELNIMSTTPNWIVEQIFLDLIETDFNIQSIANMYEVTYAIVSQISSGASYKSLLSQKYPIEYKYFETELKGEFKKRTAESQGIEYPSIINVHTREVVRSISNNNKFARDNNIGAPDLNQLLKFKKSYVKGWVRLDWYNSVKALLMLSKNYSAIAKEFRTRPEIIKKLDE